MIYSLHHSAPGRTGLSIGRGLRHARVANIQQPSMPRYGRQVRLVVMASGGDSLAKNTRDHVLVLFSVKKRVKFGERVGVLGSVPELGDWKPEEAFLLNFGRIYPHTRYDFSNVPGPDEEGAEDIWSGGAYLPVGKEVEFKVVIVDEQHGNKLKAWVNDLVDDQNLKLKIQAYNTLAYPHVTAEVRPA